MTLEMATEYFHRAASSTVAVGTAAFGVLAQAVPETEFGKIGAGGVVIGATYLLIAFVREAAPPLLKWAEISAASRNDRIRTQAELEHVRALHEADAMRIAALEARVAEAEQEARDAKNEIENAKIAADIRHAALEEETQKVRHAARNNAHVLAIATQRLDDVEKVVGGSGDRDPEIAL